MCSNKQLLINKIDSLDYTDVLSEIESWDEKLYLFKSIWWTDIDFFKSYLNSNSLYENNFEEFAELYKKNTSTSPDFFIDYFSRKVISGLTRIENSERLNNIKKVNEKQKNDLMMKLCFWKNIWENVRNLVLYFRKQCMPEFEFQIIFHVLNSLITSNWNNFSHCPTSLFNNLLIVSRSSQNVPEFAQKKYIDVTGQKFKDIMTLWSNGLHLTEGTLYEDRIMWTTTHIAWKAVLNKTESETWYNKKMWKNYVWLDLNFVDKKFINTNKLGIEEIMQTTIDAVIKLEKHMIEKA